MAKVEQIMVEDESGQRQYVRKITLQKRTNNLSGAGSIDGLPSYETADRKTCNRDGDEFVIVNSGKRLRLC